MDLPIPASLAAPAKRALAGAGVISLSDLGTRSEAEILDLHGMGPNAMKRLKQAMQEAGMEFAKAAPSQSDLP